MFVLWLIQLSVSLIWIQYVSPLAAYVNPGGFVHDTLSYCLTLECIVVNLIWEVILHWDSNCDSAVNLRRSSTENSGFQGKDAVYMYIMHFELQMRVNLS